MPEALFWSSSEEGIDELEAFFEYAGYKARDMREPLGDTKDYLQHIMEMQFLTEGDYRSGGWVPLDGRYEAWKIVHAPGEPILVLTHETKDIVLSDSAWFVGMKEAEFAPNSEKAGWHQVGIPDRHGGGRRHDKPNPLPSRPILELGEYDYSYIEELFWQWLDELRSANIRRGVPNIALRPPIF